MAKLLSYEGLEKFYELINEKYTKTKDKGQANGYCPLNEESVVSSEYLPSYVDDAIEGYYNKADSKFYSNFSDGNYSGEIEGESGKIYIDISTSASYRWSGSLWVEITSGPYNIITNAEISELFA